MINPNDAHGAVVHTNIPRKPDYLFRVSMKALVLNDEGSVLVVKESKRDWWDLPGGGMDHGESIKNAIRRELNEEVLLTGDFDYEVILVEDPVFLSEIKIWQIRIIFKVKPENIQFSPGEDGDEVQFVDPIIFRDSDIATEQRIYSYWQMAHKS